MGSIISYALIFWFLSVFEIFNGISHVPDHTHYVWCAVDLPQYVVTKFSWKTSNKTFFVIFSVLVTNAAPILVCYPSIILFGVSTYSWWPLYLLLSALIFLLSAYVIISVILILSCPGMVFFLVRSHVPASFFLK